MKNGFVKTAALTPEIFVADCRKNAQAVLDLIKKAADDGVKLAVFPELCLTGYTCSDLFLQRTLTDSALRALKYIVRESMDIDIVSVVGLPVRIGGSLYNCAAVISRGRILGVVPKTNLPNYSEFYEKRHFSCAPGKNRTVELCGQDVVFGANVLFRCTGMDDFTFAVEICEDLWVPSPPSSRHAAAGARIIVNLSASDETVGKAGYRKLLVMSQSARLVAGYVYADAGCGESTTDMVFSGHNIIAENGTVLCESKPFGEGYAVSEIDVEKLTGERVKMALYGAGGEEGYEIVDFELDLCETELTREIEKYPFVPQDESKRRERCEMILSIQANGLKKRLEHSHASTAVIGISGGLDSTLALLVAVRAFDMMGRDRRGITAVTMPCFGTTKRTKGNAERLCEQLGVTLRCVNITSSVMKHFEDIGHDIDKRDVTYENSQARERTQVLMDIANEEGGIVVGTGDLSELALGWATYNGDHMSMYGVNASVPKTLVRYIVLYAAETSDNSELKGTLLDILDTPVSPELLPAEDDRIAQRTEDIVGPYELHDFFLYYAVRYAFEPSKIYRLALYAFAGEYDGETVYKWLKKFYRRFFAQQFKRSCLPDAPKVGSTALSPRGDWRMPSDACADAWIDDLAKKIQPQG